MNSLDELDGRMNTSKERIGEFEQVKRNALNGNRNIKKIKT